MEKENRIKALTLKVEACERRARFYASRYHGMRDYVRAAKVLKRIELARAYSLEAWRARQCLDYARDDRRAALAELEAARNEKN